MKRFLGQAVLFLLPAVLCLAEVAQALEIVYPEDKTYVVQSDFLIIKGGKDPRLQGMTVEINGAKSDLIDISGADYRAAFDDFLILQPSFDPGKNIVKVEGYVGSKIVQSVEADIFYLNGDPSALPPRGYRPFVMHIPEKEQLCASCHNMDPDRVELQADSERMNPCASCHRRMVYRDYVHGPAGVYRCAYCHDPGSKPQKYKVRDHDAQLCNECHMEKVAEFKQNKYVHGPVGAGLCSVCHDSHGSAHPAQLLASVNDLCLGCHAGLDKDYHVIRGVSGDSHPLEGIPDPSRMGKQLSCASCHDPHGGMAPALFRRGITGRFALCQICHQK